MDTSFWTRFNPNITFDYVTKKYYNKYLYKLVVYAPGGRLIESKEQDLNKPLQIRIAAFNARTTWWGYKRDRDIQSADTAFLNVLRNLKRSTLNIKMRVEEPHIQIYAESDKDLQDLVIDHFQMFRKYTETVVGPEDSAAVSVLNSGAIIRRTDNGYKYKVTLRDGNYGVSVKQNVINYLTSLGPEVAHLPKGLIKSLHSGFLWNGYFYSNDLNVNSFLLLIAPGIISNTHELVVHK